MPILLIKMATLNTNYMKYRFHSICLTFFVCFFSYGQTLKPYAVGIVVSDIEKSSTWYAKVLDMKLTKELSFPEYDSLKINFLEGNGFRVELIEKKTSFSITDYVGNYSVNDKPLIGFSKIAFLVPDIQTIYNRLKTFDVEVLYDITKDALFHSEYFIIQDLDGNIIQFIENES